MKNKQLTKESQGKISWFLRRLSSGRRGQSKNRQGVRQGTGQQSMIPNSTKIGKGDCYRLRSVRKQTN